MKLKLPSKGNISILEAAGFGILMLVVTMAVGIFILTTMGTSITASAASSALNNGTLYLASLLNWLPVLIPVIAAVAIFFYLRFMRGRGM